MKKMFFALVGSLALFLPVLIGSADIWAKEGAQKWAFETGGSVVSSPAIGSDGTIYVGSNDGNLYAINPTGSLKWTFQTGGAVHSHPAIGSDGTIYVGSWDHYLYAINPDGSLKWTFPTKGEVNSSPIIGSDGTIYVGSWDHYLYAINPDGSLKWTFLTSGQLFSTPAIGPDSTIYVASWDHCIYAINTGSRGVSVSKKATEVRKQTEVPLPSTKISTEIKEIKFEVTSEGEEKVFFLLSPFHPPKKFALNGERPRLVCDFFNARLAKGIGHRIKIKGNLIRNIRTAFHKGPNSKVRVVMDLAPNQDYHTEQILLKDENLYIITVRSTKSLYRR